MTTSQDKAPPHPDGETDENGHCIYHNFVQLKRYSERTGNWMTLLDTCPICADSVDNNDNDDISALTSSSIHSNVLGAADSTMPPSSSSSSKQRSAERRGSFAPPPPRTQPQPPPPPPPPPSSSERRRKSDEGETTTSDQSSVIPFPLPQIVEEEKTEERVKKVSFLEATLQEVKEKEKAKPLLPREISFSYDEDDPENDEGDKSRTKDRGTSSSGNSNGHPDKKASSNSHNSGGAGQEAEDTRRSSVLDTTSDCDSEGYCIDHPQVRLRRKVPGDSDENSSEWEVLMKACPECCKEKLLAMANTTISSTGRKGALVDNPDSDPSTKKHTSFHSKRSYASSSRSSNSSGDNTQRRSRRAPPPPPRHTRYISPMRQEDATTYRKDESERSRNSSTSPRDSTPGSGSARPPPPPPRRTSSNLSPPSGSPNRIRRRNDKMSEKMRKSAPNMGSKGPLQALPFGVDGANSDEEEKLITDFRSSTGQLEQHETRTSDDEDVAPITTLEQLLQSSKEKAPITTLEQLLESSQEKVNTRHRHHDDNGDNNMAQAVSGSDAMRTAPGNVSSSHSVKSSSARSVQSMRSYGNHGVPRPPPPRHPSYKNDSEAYGGKGTYPLSPPSSSAQSPTVEPRRNSLSTPWFGSHNANYSDEAYHNKHDGDTSYLLENDRVPMDPPGDDYDIEKALIPSFMNESNNNRRHSQSASVSSMERRLKWNEQTYTWDENMAPPHDESNSVLSNSVLSNGSVFSNGSRKSNKRKKKKKAQVLMRVKNLRFKDADGNEGWYTGKVNRQFLPHDKHGYFFHQEEDDATFVKQGRWKNGEWRGGDTETMIDGDLSEWSESMFSGSSSEESSVGVRKGQRIHPEQGSDIVVRDRASMASEREKAAFPTIDDDSCSYTEESNNRYKHKDGATTPTSHREHRKQPYRRVPYERDTCARKGLIVGLSTLAATGLLIFIIFYAMNDMGSNGKGAVAPGPEVELEDTIKTTDSEDIVSTIAEIEPISTASNTSSNSNSITSLVTASGDASTTGQGKSFGILFDIETSQNLHPFSSMFIVNMDLYVVDTTNDLPIHYEIWTKPGSWQDNNMSAPTTNPEDYLSGFRKVSHGTISKGESSYLDDFSVISLKEFQLVQILGAGTRQAFWVTLSDNVLLFQNYETADGIASTDGLGSIVQASNKELQVYYGTAVRAYPLDLADPSTDFRDNAGFMGRIWTKHHSPA